MSNTLTAQLQQPVPESLTEEHNSHLVMLVAGFALSKSFQLMLYSKFFHGSFKSSVYLGQLMFKLFFNKHAIHLSD